MEHAPAGRKTRRSEAPEAEGAARESEARTESPTGVPLYLGGTAPPDLLEVAPADDPLEAGAERDAERVLAGRDADPGSAAAPGSPAASPSPAASAPPAPTSRPPAPAARRSGHPAAPSRAAAHPARADGGAPLLARAEAGAPPAAATARDVDAAAGGGHPLPDAARSRFEAGFGRPLHDVRLHTGGRAADLSAALGARAFTRGSDVFFGRGRYEPGSAGGRGLLAHELAHVVQQREAPVRIQRQAEEHAGGGGGGGDGGGSPPGGEGNPRDQSFSLSEDEMEARLSATPPGGADTSAPAVEVAPETESTLDDVEGGDAAEGGEGAGEGGEGEGGEPEAEGAREGEREREGEGGRGEGEGRGTPPGESVTPPTPGPASEYEGMVAGDVSAYLEGHLDPSRLEALGGETEGLLQAADALGARSITDPDAAAMSGLEAGPAAAGPQPNPYEGEPAWLRTLATIRDVTGELGGIVGIIGLVATVSGFILSLLIPPVGAFLLTVGRFADIAALILDGISFVLGIILTSYNLYRLKNETNPDERRRLLGMVRQDAMKTVMSGIAVATAVAPGASRLLGRGGRRVAAGLRAASRSGGMAGRAARAVRVVGVSGRLAVRAGRRGAAALGRSAAAGFRSLSRSGSLLGRAARGVRVAGVSARLAARSARGMGRRALLWARGTAPVRWANRLGGGAEEWARRRLRTLAASDTALGRFYNRRIRGFHERNVMIARSINDPVERAYQLRLGRELQDELDRLRQANPGWSAQQLDDALRARFGRERYGHAEVGTSTAGNTQFVRDDSTFLREVRETEFTEIQLIRDANPGATPAELARLANESPFIKGIWTEGEMRALTGLHPATRQPTGALAVRRGARGIGVSKTGHHTLPAGMAPQISRDPRFIQIANDLRFASYRPFIQGSHPGLNWVPTGPELERMLDQGLIQGYSRADLAYFRGQGLVDDLVAGGSTGVWRNPRVPGQQLLFNPHFVIGHGWDWNSEIARQIFDMSGRLGLSLPRELLTPLLRRSGHLIGDAAAPGATDAGASPEGGATDGGDTDVGAGGGPVGTAARPDARTQAVVDAAMRARRQESPQVPPPELPPLLEPLPPEMASAAATGEAPEPLAPSPAPVADVGEDEGAPAPGTAGVEATLALVEGGEVPVPGEVPGATGGGGASPAEPVPGEPPPVPPDTVPFSPNALVSIRSQREAVADAVGTLNDYVRDAGEAEVHNRQAGDAAGTLRERSAEEGETASAERGVVAGEQEKLTRAGGAQETMASQNQEATSQAQRGEGEAGSVQEEGQGVSVEPKEERPEAKGWLERAWAATAGALWDRLVAPAVRAVRRKVSEVMQSINDFITRMINQALGLDEIEAELNAGGNDIGQRGESLTETDTGLQETEATALQEQERNAGTIVQAEENVADAAATREDATALRADLLAHDETLHAEEMAGADFILDFEGRYSPFFEGQAEGAGGVETVPPWDGGVAADAAGAAPEASEPMVEGMA